MEALKNFYKSKLDRKNRLIKEYLEEKNSEYGFKSVKREIEYNRLDAEINLIKNLLSNLEVTKL